MALRRSSGGEETICAIATPQGEGGIGIIRLSGSDARSIVAPLYNGHDHWTSFKSHTVHYGEIIDPVEKTPIDEALFLLMIAPHSYTGEDVVEIQAHGNPLVLEKILSLLLKQGARLAEPGEFTRRAFLSGRVDLAQAEAVMEIISAKSDKQHQWALSQLKGHISHKITLLRKRLITILAEIEAAIDFSEDEIPLRPPDELCREVNSVLLDVQSLIKNYSQGRKIREGFTVVIVGRPNVGKSSLLNFLLQEDRAIVTSVAGTTRDILQEQINIKGILVRITDTAGYQKTLHPIEQEGVRRADLARKEADLVLWVLDVSQVLKAEDLHLAQELRNGKTLVVFNKTDLPVLLDKAVLANLNCYKAVIDISVKTGEGLEKLQDRIIALLLSQTQKEPPFVALLRHRNALVSAESYLNTAIVSLREGLSWEFPAIDLREAVDSLGEITGETALDEILDNIFNQFCIGK